MARKLAEETDESDSAGGSDMQMSLSDPELEMDADTEAGEERSQADGEDADVEVDVEEEDDQPPNAAIDEDEEMQEQDIEPEEVEPDEVDGEDADPEPEPEPEPAPRPSLKIKLKLPPNPSNSSASGSAVPTPNELPERHSRRAISRDIDIESEDSEPEGVGSTRSTSVATTATPGRALTARQAVLANVVDSSHVSLVEPANPRKKKPLTEIEIALKREETARKRRNLSEKKLEDEKAETINRLLKKQSRARGKRNALSTAEDRPSLVANSNNTPADADEVADGVGPEPVVPTMYRWISSVRTQPAQGDQDPEQKMTLSFSVPVAVLPNNLDEKNKMDVDTPAQDHNRISHGSRECDIQGCAAPRKYRLVRDWTRGACGMGHLKMLEGQVV